MFDIWYCPDYPLDSIQVSTKVYRDDFDLWRPALVENIAQQGLVNPLIVLNHRSGKYKNNWLLVGNNRYWALKYLLWTHAPVLITGSCEYPAVKVTLEEAQRYVKDGELYIHSNGDHHTLRLRNFTDPSKFEFPSQRY